MLLAMSMAIYAQKEVTKFLGIPVDGTKSAMIQKLKVKGFTYNATGDYLEGEFNGSQVNVFIVTNNNKVCRIMVADKSTVDEGDIKIRFNNLCRQFERNKKYGKTPFGDHMISDDEDISYEITVHNKQYQAMYFQKPEAEGLDEDSDEYKEKELDCFVNKSVWFTIGELYGKYYIAMFYDNEYNRAHGEDL